MTAGHVWLIGAGPGDPGLITVAGASAVAEADVVLYDALAPAALLRGARPGAEIVFVGKRAGSRALSQAEIESLMVDRALAGAKVARLKGGDPFVFGRGGEEALACAKADVPFTVIPGVTSAIAAPAYAGIPLTYRGIARSFMVVTGSDSPEHEGGGVDWVAAAGAGTLVVLMGLSSLEASMAALVAAGKDPATPAACVRWGTRPDQQVVQGTVGTIACLAREAGLQVPVVTVVGEVVGLSREIGWYRPGPLAGRRVVVTRARAQASGLASRLEALGAQVVEAPVIAVTLRTGDTNLQDCLQRRWDWVVFTSANAVEAVFGALAATGLDARALAGAQIAVVGEGTAAALGRYGLRADFVPSLASSEALVNELPLKPRETLFLPASALADDRLRLALENRAAAVTHVDAYHNEFIPLDAERLREVAEAHAVTFTSASTARNLRTALGETPLPAGAKLVSIGAQTSTAVREAFGRVDAEAAQPGLEALVEAVVEALA